MSEVIMLSFDTMPKGTAQQKRYNGRTHTYFKSKSLRETEEIFFESLFPFAPDEPSEAPIRLNIVFHFDVKDKKKWRKYKTSVPDVDNYAKAFIDQMTRCGFWKDDSQIADLHLVKMWSERASVFVEWEELKDETH